MNPRTQDIVVNDRYGAFTTNRVLGTSGSSTSSPESAALSLAQKLFGKDLLRIEKVSGETNRRTTWRAYAKPFEGEAK